MGWSAGEGREMGRGTWQGREMGTGSGVAETGEGTGMRQGPGVWCTRAGKSLRGSQSL